MSILSINLLYLEVCRSFLLLKQVLKEANAKRSLSPTHQDLRVVGQVEIIDPAHFRQRYEHYLVDGEEITDEQSLYHALLLFDLR